MDAQRSGLLSLQVDIHNSLSILCINGAILSHDSFPDDIFREARRANSFIKTQKHFGENLHGLLNSKGRPSDTFPKTVNDLLAFDGLPSPLHPSLSIAHSLGPQMPRSSSW